MKTWKIPPISPHWKLVLDQYKYIFLVILVGLFLLLLPTQENTDTFLDVPIETKDNTYNIREFEAHLAENLSLIHGAGETQVVLTLKNDGETKYATDIQNDPQGKFITETVTVGSGNNETAIETQQFYPEFQGALIICSGGDNPSVQLQLIKAVSALTGLRSDNITVCESIK